ncbi:MAG: phosphotransferase [Acidobacteria bacterium]|nr:phosphotransferase [Acidobacteriota bacterium]
MSELSCEQLEAEGALRGLRLPPIARTTQMQGHASTRRFYRLTTPGNTTAVLVTYPVELAAEGVERYVRTTEWCRRADIAVPRIYQVGERSILVQDGGDRLLDSIPAEAGRRLYDQAGEIMARVWRAGRRHGAANEGWALDRARFEFEFGYLESHAFGTWLENAGDARLRAELYVAVASRLAELPTVMCHRDFHSRNLAVHGERLLVVGYQDLMWGPVFYDPVSLLLDNYVDVADEITASVLRGLVADGPLHNTVDSSLAVPDWPLGLGSADRQAFVLTALQRSLKALGTFGYQVAVAGNDGFAAYVPRTCRHIDRCLASLGLEQFRPGLAALDRFMA